MTNANEPGQYFSFRSDVCDATYDHSCYVIITEALSLAVAVDRCAFMGGHLAVITSAAEQQALVGISSGIRDTQLSLH